MSELLFFSGKVERSLPTVITGTTPTWPKLKFANFKIMSKNGNYDSRLKMFLTRKNWGKNDKILWFWRNKKVGKMVKTWGNLKDTRHK